jgi:hypothetical protein
VKNHTSWRCDVAMGNQRHAPLQAQATGQAGMMPNGGGLSRRYANGCSGLRRVAWASWPAHRRKTKDPESLRPDHTEPGYYPRVNAFWCFGKSSIRLACGDAQAEVGASALYASRHRSSATTHTHRITMTQNLQSDLKPRYLRVFGISAVGEAVAQGLGGKTRIGSIPSPTRPKSGAGSHAAERNGSGLRGSLSAVPPAVLAVGQAAPRASDPSGRDLGLQRHPHGFGQAWNARDTTAVVSP